MLPFKVELKFTIEFSFFLEGIGQFNFSSWDQNWTWIAAQLTIKLFGNDFKVSSETGIFCCNVFCHFFRSLFETLEPSKWTYEDPCLWFLVSLDTVKYFAQLFFTAGRLLGVRNFIASGSREKGVLLQLHISRRGAGERYFSITILSWIVVCSLCALWRQIAVVPLRVCWKFSSTNRCYVLKTHFRGCKQPTWNISRPKKSEGTRLIKVFATFCS